MDDRTQSRIGRRSAGRVEIRSPARAGRTLKLTVLAAAALGLCACELAIPDVTRQQHPTPEPEGTLAVKDGRLRALHPAAATAGSVRVVEGVLDIGPPSCGGDGRSRACVRGGLIDAQAR